MSSGQFSTAGLCPTWLQSGKPQPYKLDELGECVKLYVALQIGWQETQVVGVFSSREQAEAADQGENLLGEASYTFLVEAYDLDAPFSWDLFKLNNPDLA